jgi:hypothetical protein
MRIKTKSSKEFFEKSNKRRGNFRGYQHLLKKRNADLDILFFSHIKSPYVYRDSKSFQW